MYIQSCLNPVRVWNKYINEYVWTGCGHCEACRVRKASKWTAAMERERYKHRFSFFVTLTYSDENLPRLTYPSFMGSRYLGSTHLDSDTPLIPNKEDELLLHYSDFEVLFTDKNDKQLFDSLLKDTEGVPYCSTIDIQLFHKRLNKYIFSHVTSKYKNFRYFVVQEFGSTTFRPHIHGVYYVDDPQVAERFEECVLASWKYGRVDIQFVESSACAYVAQYVNKSDSLPDFYKEGALRPRFFFSKHPTIGDFDESDSTLQEIFDNPTPTRIERPRRVSTRLVDVQIASSLQNRIFPKCFSYDKVTRSTRIALYSIISRFEARNWKDLANKIVRFCQLGIFESEFDYLIRDHYYKLITLEGDFYSWVKRLYYTSKRVYDNCFKFFGFTQFRYAIVRYLDRIEEYYSKKELWLLRQFYEFQEKVSEFDSDSLVTMYPEYCFCNLGHPISVLENYDSPYLKQMRSDYHFYEDLNTKTHFKNGYIEAQELRKKNKPYYSLLKRYHYAKKCNETRQAFAS